MIPDDSVSVELRTFWAAKMHHMGRASVRDLRYHFKDVETQLAAGEEIEIVKGKKVIAKLVPVSPVTPPDRPDVMARLREIWGDRIPEFTNAELIAEGRERF
jgi:antitoxin (DNA-binding transcriptional repressor) of toxin-antitoxin stability system